MVKLKKKKRTEKPCYFFENSKGFFLYDLGLHRGRAFMKKGKVFDIDRSSHPKMVNSIKKLGKKIPCN